MAGVETTSKWQIFLEEALDEAYKAGGNELEPIYPKYLKVKETTQNPWISYRYAGLGKHQLTAELNPTPYDQYETGAERKTYMKTYRLATRFSRELLDDVAAGNRVEQRLEAFGDVMKEMKKSAIQTKEELAAQIILQGTSTTVSDNWTGAGRDGVALVSSAHTTLRNGVGTFSNSASAASLSHTTLLSMLTTLETIPDDSGRYQKLGKKATIIAGPASRTKLYEIINAKGQPSNNYNDANALDQFDFDVVINPYLGSSFTGYAVAVMDDRFRLHFFDRQKESLQKEVDNEVNGLKYFSIFRCAVDHLDARGWVYNAGA